jgi:hypothetical protein
MYLVNRIKRALAVLLLLIIVSPLRADDGMWLLALLKKYNAEQLKRLGLRIPVDAISGEKDGALSEAVVAFGSGCTGSIISSEGLILTNYHCSYGAIQQLNNPVRDLSNLGFWAKDRGQELPVGGITVTINKKILDITGEVKQQLSATAPAGGVKEALETVGRKYQQAYPKYKVLTKSYKNNTLFVLYLQLQYKDVRLVGLAPKSVAKFGGETDNWMWPRHSADFAFFRVYADKQGQPAAFSPSNVPLGVSTYLHISTEGYQKGDFAMSMGYPAQSDRNATSTKIWEKVAMLNPPMIAARRLRQGILEEEMAASKTNAMVYAEKYATSANYYKNAVGMNDWVARLGTIAKKEAFEQSWLNWAGSQSGRPEEYRDLLKSIRQGVEENAPYKRALMYSSEGFINSCDMIGFLHGFGKGFPSFAAKVEKQPSLRRDYLQNLSMHYKGFDLAVDKRVTKAIMRLVFDSVPEPLRPDIYEKKQLHTKEDVDRYVEEVFATSLFADSARLSRWLKNPQTPIDNDPALQLAESINAKHLELIRKSGTIDTKIYRGLSAYNASVAEYNSNLYYPDADKTIRLSYGTVEDLSVDGKTKPFQTSLSGLMAKADAANKDFLLHPQLAEIWKQKDFGRYGVNGDMPVCFVTNGDVTGGNSGSPMLNGEGKLIGLVFDCNWESMTREFNYEQSLHRVICTDIRYVMLLTEKFSGSQRLTNEIFKTNTLL